MAHQLRRVIVLVALAALALAPIAGAATPTNSAPLRSAVTLGGIGKHMAAFQAIADRNDGTRASGTPGYDESADYVARKLRRAGYRVTEQQFTFPFFQELAPAEFAQISPSAKTYSLGEDFLTMEYSGSGDVTGAVIPTNDVKIPPSATPSSTSGCEASDFVPASATAPQVALIQRGTCTFAQKAANAESAGYDAVIIFNEGQEGRTDVVNGTLGGPDFNVPVVGTTFAVGEELYRAATSGGATVRVFTSTLSETRTTRNVIADTTTGRTDRVVVVGSHLDSVPEGPGINDNGSGSATDLEVALQMAKLGIKPRNQVRFAFWGAEESGLLGSEHYVSQLTAGEKKNIAVNLNFDMLGSPNFVRFVYDGDGSDTPDKGPTGSGTVEDVFTDYFDSQGLETEPTAFDGRSDYGPFIAEGIPAGGLFSGAEDIKTAEEQAIYGGIAGEQHDPCYHESCDTLDSVFNFPPGLPMLQGNGAKGLNQLADGVAHGTLALAQTTSAVSGTDKGNATGKVGDLEYQGSRQQR